MKRYFSAVLAGLVCSTHLTASDEPPADEWPGWYSPEYTEWTSASEYESLNLTPQFSFLPPIAEALAYVPAENLAAQTFDIGLSRYVAKGSDDLVMETARGLDCNWARCYLFVRNEIKFTPCRGVSRGPERTLMDREGSAADQAFLLMALLRASGHADAKVYYVSVATGGFRIPLGGTETGYDAVSWLGVSADDTVSNVWISAARQLGVARLEGTGVIGPTLETSSLWVEHYWVRLTLDGQTYDLDPSFKARRLTPRSESIVSDMGYTRTNLLAAAGGTTNALSVQGLSSQNLYAELRRLAANLAERWKEAGTQATAKDFVGADEIVSQDPATDACTFHGVIGGTPVDFLAQSDTAKNAMRYSLKIQHVGITTNVWLDEVGSRRLWLSYTNASQAYPKAVLNLDDTVLATEPSGSSSAGDWLSLTVIPPFYTPTYACNYTIARSLSNVYAIPVGFGGDSKGGMRDRAQAELERVLGSGVSATDRNLRSCVLHVVGQQWLAQTAMVNSFNSRFDGSNTRYFYNIGLAAQTASPYVDLKNCLIYSTGDASRLSASSLFSSALEHAALDQVNGTNRPAVSTVRVICLANAANTPIYFGNTGNFSTVRGQLTSYDTSLLNSLHTSITNNRRKILLPKDGTITLNSWSSYAYIGYGPWGNGYSTEMMIGNGLAGGFSSVSYVTPPSAVSQQYSAISLPSMSAPSYSIADPVDARSGAFLSEKTDLALGGPVPLSLARRYDSRLRSMSGPFGKGWSHSYSAEVNRYADPDALVGRGSPAACAASAVACAVVNDLIDAGENAKNLAVACLVTQWWADQLVNGAASAQVGGSSLSFTRSPDGAYIPTPGVTATLSCSNNTVFVLSERLGPTWRFNTQGNLDRVEDASGKFTRLYYNTQTNLVAVSNSFGGKLSFSWSGGRISSVSDSAGRSTAYSYNPSGCLTSVTDAAGFVWKASYGAGGTLVTETEPGGAVTILNAYNALGQVTNQVSATGYVSTFAYADGTRTVQRDPVGGVADSVFDDEGRLVERTGPDGGVSLFYYDAQGQAVTNLDAVGRARVSVYDASNRLVRVTEAAGTADARTTHYAYDSRHRMTAVTNALGRVTRMSYDSCDRPVLTIAPDGVAVTNGYDSHGLPILTRTLDVAGNVVAETVTVYDSRGFPSQVTSIDAGTSRFGCDLAGNVTNVTDALGHSTRIFYDRRGLPTNTVNALGGRTVRSYTPAGRLAIETDPLGWETLYYWTPGGQHAATRFADGGVATNEYDGADRLVAAADTRGNRVAMGLDLMGHVTNRCGQAWQETAWYNAAGLATARVDAVAGLTLTVYDALDRPMNVTDPLGRTRSAEYDALGSVTGATDPRGRTTAYAYDLAGHSVRVTYPSGRSESNAYDAQGRTVAFTNAEGRVYRMSYDAQGRLLAATNAAGERVAVNVYDLAGNLTNRVDGCGRATRYEFDALNRRTAVRYADGSAETFTHDAAGNLMSAGNGASTNVFGYDAMNRLTSAVTRVSGQSLAVRYAYDLGGLATNIVYPDGKTVRYGYDAAGRVTNVTDWAGRTFAFTRDEAGRLTALAYPNGVSGAWQHDANHAVSSWGYSAGGSQLAGRVVDRDEAGVKIKEQLSSGLFPNPQSPRRAANTFDAADRLVSATVAVGTNTFAETYLYDGCGALTNRQSAIGDQQFEYDCAGRLTFLQLLTPHTSLLLTYDALGNRLTTYSANTTRIWVTDHADPLKRTLMEADSNGNPVRWFVWGGGMLLAVVEADGVVRYAHSDEQGSMIALTDSAGAVTDQYCYGPYGNDWGHSGTNAIPFRWLGSHGVFNVGGSALHLTRHRAYDTYTGRFLSSDPLGLGGGPNLYSYCLGNPLSYIDPIGLSVSAAGWNVGTRLGGAGQLIGGIAEAAGGYTFGTVTSPTVLGGIAGALVGTHGLDNAAAGFLQVVSGKPVDSLTSQFMQGVGVSRSTANIVNGIASVAFTLGTSYASMINSTPAAVQSISSQSTLGATTLAGVGDDMLVHFAQIENRASIVQNGVQSQGGYSYFLRVGDVRNLTAAQIRGVVGPSANAGANNGLAVVVSPQAASFSQVGVGFSEYMTYQNSVPWTLLRAVSGGGK